MTQSGVSFVLEVKYNRITEVERTSPASRHLCTKWPTVTHARALSWKTCKGGLHPLIIDEIDHLANYDIEIDKLDGLLRKVTKALNLEDLPDDSSEKAHYGPLISFLKF